MPGENLTRAEAQERKALIDVHSYEIDLDLTTGPRPSRARRPSGSRRSRPSLDVHRRRHQDGARDHPQRRAARPAPRSATACASSCTTSRPRTSSSSSPTPRTPTPARACTASSTRSTTRCTCTRQFEVPDSRRVFAVFEQPDLKATFQFTVTAPGELAGRQQPAHPRAREARQRRRGDLGFRPDTGALELRHRARGRAVRRGAQTSSPRSDGRVIPLGIYSPQVAEPSTSTPTTSSRRPRQGFAFYEATVRLPVPVREVRPALRARVQRRGDGERRRDHVHRDLRLPLEGHRRDQGAPRRHDPARARPHVVRRPRDDEVVERPVAQRVLRRVGVDARDRRGHRVDRGVDDVRRRWRRAGRTARTSCRRRTPSSRPSTTSRTCRSTSTASPTPRAARCSSSSSPGSGIDAFLAGVAAYFKKHAYGNTELSDLLAELEITSGRDLADWSQAVARDRRRQHAAPRDRGRRGRRDHLVRGAADGGPRATPPSARTAWRSASTTCAAARCVRDHRVELDVDGDAHRGAGARRAARARPDPASTTTTSPTRRSASTTASLAVAIEHLADIDDPLARSLVWGSAWDATRDAETTAERLRAARAQQHRAPRPSRRRCARRSTQLPTAARYYVAAPAPRRDDRGGRRRAVGARPGRRGRHPTPSSSS